MILLNGKYTHTDTGKSPGDMHISTRNTQGGKGKGASNGNTIGEKEVK